MRACYCYVLGIRSRQPWIFTKWTYTPLHGPGTKHLESHFVRPSELRYIPNTAFAISPATGTILLLRLMCSSRYRIADGRLCCLTAPTSEWMGCRGGVRVRPSLNAPYPLVPADPATSIIRGLSSRYIPLDSSFLFYLTGVKQFELEGLPCCSSDSIFKHRRSLTCYCKL